MKAMKKLMVLVLAVAMVLGTSVMTAFADKADASDSYKVASVEVDGIKAGNTLKLYKIVQFNYDPQSHDFDYTLAGTLPAAYDTIDELAAIASDGYVFTDGSAANTAADALAYAIADGTLTPLDTQNQVAGDGDKAVITNLPAGWYVAVVTGTADDGIIYQNMIINALPVLGQNGYQSAANVKFDVKHTNEKIEKEVDGGESTDQYSVGDKVPFTIKTNMPNYPNPAKYATFKITDTPDDLTDIIDATGDDKMVVKVNDQEVTRGETTYSVAQSGDGFVITFVKDYILAHPGQAIEVSYKATIKASATITEDGLTADNTANLTYNPNPNDNGEAKPDDTTTVYTYGVDVFKYKDGTNPKEKLTGAKFILYAENGETVVGAEKEVDSNGYVSWEGLGAGTYKLVETVAPEGYKLDSTPKTITLSSTDATADNRATTDTESYFLQVDVPNTEGSTLPSTGGMGTTILYVIGAILVVGCGIMLVAKKRSSNK